MTNTVSLKEILERAKIQKEIDFIVGDITFIFKVESATDRVARDLTLRAKLKTLVEDQGEEFSDEDFLKMVFDHKYYKSIKGWKGVKVKHLLPDCSQEEAEQDVKEFSRNALELFFNNNVETLGALIVEIENYLTKIDIKNAEKNLKSVEEPKKKPIRKTKVSE